MEEFLKILDISLKTFEVGQNPQTFLVLFFLSFARFFSFVAVVPFFGGSLVGWRVKSATATAFVIITYPLLVAELPAEVAAVPFGAVGFTALLAKEIFVGLTLGFVASLVFEAVRVAGRIADYQRGSATSELFAPQSDERFSHLGQFQMLLAVVIFLTSGAHRFFIGALVRSFEFVPALKFPHIEAGWTPAAEFLTVMTGNVLSIGIQLAVPVIITLLLTDFLFGLINRAAPEINAFLLSLPIKMWLGILVLAVMLPFLVESFRILFETSYRAFEFMIENMGREVQ